MGDSFNWLLIKNLKENIGAHFVFKETTSIVSSSHQFQKFGTKKVINGDISSIGAGIAPPSME